MDFQIQYDYIDAESGFQEHTGFQIYNDDTSTRPKFNIIYICLPLILAILITIFSLRYHRNKRINKTVSNRSPMILRSKRAYEKMIKHPQL